MTIVEHYALAIILGVLLTRFLTSGPVDRE
jgi:hypothetical protein